MKISGQVKSPVNPINKLCIRVAYGIEKTGLFFIQFKNLTKLRENEYEFQIQVPFSSNQVWPTAGTRLNIILSLRPDFRGLGPIWFVY